MINRDLKLPLAHQAELLVYLAEKILLLNPSNFRGDYQLLT